MDVEPPPDAAAGAHDVLGPYRLDRLLGRGGMGEVHRAWDDRRRRWVALKLLDRWTARDPEFRRRFRREAELAARLTDPHVLPVHDYGEIDGRLFLDMRLVDGPDLARVLAGGPIARTRALALLSGVASALDAAHAQGLVHRDVKPSNVLVSAGDFAYVVDFGIARELASATPDGTSAPVVPATGTDVFGTAGYVAPERLRGEAADHRADVYSLACVVFECLAGRAPYVGDDPAAIVAEQLHGPVPRPSAVDPSLPTELDVVLAGGLAASPADRPPDAGSLVRAVEAAFDGARPDPAVGRDDRAPAGSVPSPSASTRALPPPTRQGPPPGSGRGRSARDRGSRLIGRSGPGRLALLVGALIAVVLVVVLGVVAVRGYVGDGLSVGLSPVAVAPSTDGDRVVVVGGGAPSVTVVDTGRGAVSHRVPIPGRAAGASADGDRLAVTTYDGRPEQALVTMDLRTAGVVTVTTLPVPPTGPPSLSRDGTRAAVPTGSGVALVDLRTGAAPIASAAARAVAMTPDGDRVYTLDGRSTTVGVLDGSGRGEAGVVTGATAEELRLSPDGRVLAVVDDSPALTLVDTGSDRVLRRVDLPGRPSGLAFTPDGDRILVGTDRAPGADGPGVVAVDRADGRVVDTYPRERFATTVSLAVSPDGRRLYVANTDLGTLTVDPLRR